MESANIHHHQLAAAFSSSSSLSPPNCCGVGSTTSHTWCSTPSSSTLNTNGYNISFPNPESNLRPGERSPQHNIQLTSLYMAPNSGFHWGANTTDLSLTTTNQSSSPQEHLQLSRIKDVFSDHYDHLNYTELLGSSLNPSSITHHEFSLMRNQQTNLQSDDIGTKFLLKPFSSGNFTNKIDQLSPGDLSFSSRTGFSQIFPGANLSDFNQETNPGSLDMNLQAVDDRLSSSRFTGNFSPASYGLDHMHQLYQIPFHSSNKMSSDGATQAKRSSCSKLMEAKALHTAPKKSRVEARASCPPFKVRKEKLGDRIAALQQLVAPFGKTDTASVLMEAIGYIKFLENQVQTLSHPYMNNTSTNIHTTTITKAPAGGINQNESEEAKRDLRSRGLCLVPLSCMSYVADGGAVLWPPPQLGGAAT